MRLLQTISLAFCMPYLQNRFMTSVYSRFPYHVLREVYKKLGEICFLETLLFWASCWHLVSACFGRAWWGKHCYPEGSQYGIASAQLLWVTAANWFRAAFSWHCHCNAEKQRREGGTRQLLLQHLYSEQPCIVKRHLGSSGCGEQF